VSARAADIGAVLNWQERSVHRERGARSESRFSLAVYELLCALAGLPVAVELFEGNAADPAPLCMIGIDGVHMRREPGGCV
jgi:hypothetical protein